jgi:hypothetical protein
VKTLCCSMAGFEAQLTGGPLRCRTGIVEKLRGTTSSPSTTSSSSKGVFVGGKIPLLLGKIVGRSLTLTYIY